MRVYWVFVALFLVSIAMFFVGAFASNPPLAVAGIVLTLLLFVVRRSFLKGVEESNPE